MNKIFVLLLSCIMVFAATVNSQELRVELVDPPVEVSGNFGDWGNDLVAFNNEPMGPVSGIIKSDTLIIAVPDTNGAPTGALRLLKSSNNGANWVNFLNVTSVGVITKTRLVKSGLDTVYCAFMNTAGSIYILRVNLPLVDPLRIVFSGGYRSFDSWASSTGGFYMFLDSLGTNSIPRLASTNGGITWSQRAIVSSAGALPYCNRSITGDTCVLMYYRDPFAADTTTQGITLARYRESAPGTLSSLGFIQPLIPAGLQHDQFAGVLIGATGWVIYTEGAPGARNLMLLTSVNNGANWSAPVALTAGTADKYWFDIRQFTLGSGGVDLIYYFDSTGGPSNTTDKIIHNFANTTTPGSFGVPSQISEFYPQFSTRGYVPILIEYYNTNGDAGALWVGQDGANKRLYFDRLAAVVGVNNNENGIPETYKLSQNYPNPFNPNTKIDFSIPKNSLVSIKVYDVLGKEVAILVNKDFVVGSYTVDFNASSLTSGVYFYTISAGDFTETKKLILVK